MTKSSKFGLFSVLILLVFFSFSSCLKGLESVPEIAVEPPSFGNRYRVDWKEIEKRIDSEEWQTVDCGNTLAVYFNYTDFSKKNLIGLYRFFSISSKDLDRGSWNGKGGVKMGENYISFTYVLSLKPYKYTTSKFPIYQIKKENDTLLVIRNTSNTPITEVKYKKVYYIDEQAVKTP